MVAIAAGSIHSLALKSDGTVVAWGGNTFEHSAVPEGLNSVVSIAAGLTLKSDGTVVAWGKNTFEHSAVPEGLNSVVSIAVGGTRILALRRRQTITFTFK